MVGMKRVMLWTAAACVGGWMYGSSEQLMLAEGLFNRGMHAQAAQEYEAFLPSAPAEKLAEVQFKLAQCKERLKQHAEARALYQKVIDGTNGDRRVSAQLSLANLMMKDGEPQEAVNILESLIAAKPSAELRSASIYQLGHCYEMLGRRPDAATLYNMLTLEPGTYTQAAKLALAEISLKEGKSQEALKLYQGILDGEPNDARKREIAVGAFGAAYAAKAYAEAAALARVAGDKKLAEVNLLLPAAWMAFQADLPEEARAWLAAEKQAHAEPTADRLMLEGNIATKLGDDVAAITAYERLLAEFPKSPMAYAAAEQMLALRFKAGDQVKFLDGFKRVATLLDKEALTRFTPLRLDAAIKSKDKGHAQAATAWLTENGSAEAAAEANYRLAWLYQQSEQWKEAAELWLQTAEKWQQAKCAGRAAYAAAYAFHQAGLPDRVTHALSLALASGDGEVVPDALMMRAQMALAERDTASAASTYDEYLTRFPQGKGAAEAAYYRGMIFFNAKDFKAAEERLGKALEMSVEGTSVTPLDHKRKTDASMRRAQSLYELGRGDEAALLLQPLVALKDTQVLDAAYLRWLTDFRLERKEWAEAEEVARVLTLRAEASPVDKVFANVLLGRAAEGRGQTATAISAYENALSISTKPTSYDAEAACNLGALRLGEGNAQKAKEAFALAIARKDTKTPKGRGIYARSYAGLAEATRKLGAVDEALRANMSIIIFFDDANIVPTAYRNAIEILEEKGETQQAASLKVEFAQRYPNL